MNKIEKKGFTLIELIAVLVIMAIIALIVTSLVMSIIRKARISADKRSVDAYGRSIEIAIAGYLLDTGTFPTSMNQLTVEYKGDEVVCTTTQIKSDSSVYLAGCTVGGRSVDGYTYGSEEAAPTYTAYKVGDEVKYNNVDYYVIKDSSASEETVTLLKAEPLTTSEVTNYKTAAGIGLNSTITENKAEDINGYGGMEFDFSSGSGVYSESNIKKVVDLWANEIAPAAKKARLIQYDEFENLGYVEGNQTPSNIGWVKTDNTPSWVYNSSYVYWTMSQYNDSSSVWHVDFDGKLLYAGNINSHYVVRPVITISKSALN